MIKEQRIIALIKDAIFVIEGSVTNEKATQCYAAIKKYYINIRKVRPNIYSEIEKAIFNGIKCKYGVSYKFNIHTLMHWINEEIKNTKDKKVKL